MVTSNRQHWRWVWTIRETGREYPVDEVFVRDAMVAHTHDIDRAIQLGYQGENLETPRSFYRYDEEPRYTFSGMKG